MTMRLFYTLLLSAISTTVFAQSKTMHVIYFDLDKWTPTQSSQAEFSRLLQELAKLPVSAVQVKGYTDRKGDADYNMRLSQQRADAVAAELRKVLPKNVEITTSYYGENDLLTNEEEAQDRNRRVQLFISYVASKAEDVQVQAFFEDVEEQAFQVDLSDTVIVTGKNGTLIKIAPGSIQNKQGKTVSGEAKLLLKEYYEAGDILLAGMHSSSEKGLLQTGGMFRLLVVQNGDTMQAQTKKKVQIQMPVRKPQLDNMNIYTMNHDTSSSARWRNTGIPFSMLAGYWQWPKLEKLKDARPDQDVRLEFWRVGSTHYRTTSIGPWICLGCGGKYPTKSVDLSFRKIGRDSLQVHVKANYRRKASKRFGQNQIDTSYLVTFRRPAYAGEIGAINLINCDRFYDYPNKTDFYVTTPGYKGMNVLAYFKRLNAFMLTAAGTDDFLVAGVPENEEVYIVAFGKKEKDYYLSIQPYTIQKNGRVAVSFARMDEATFKKELEALEEL